MASLKPIATGVAVAACLAGLVACGSATPADTSRPSQQNPTGYTRDSGGAAALTESLLFGSLRVRALSYQKSGVGGAANGTRLDVVTVAECAAGATAQMQHRTWHLVDAGGKTLGVAGGKVVDGHPSEDLPRTLSPGRCVQTELIIGVPMGSDPAAVMDGPSNTWSLDD